MSNSLVLSENFFESRDLTNSLDYIFQDYEKELAGIQNLYNLTKGNESSISYFCRAYEINGYVAERLFDLDKAVKILDSDYWKKLFDKTNVKEFMSAEKRNEWAKQIREGNTPPFTRDNALDTVRYLLENRGSFLVDKVYGIYKRLSRSHSTNKGMGFNDRFIINNLYSYYGTVDSDTESYIHDLRSLVSIIKNENSPSTYSTSTILSAIKRKNGVWIDMDGGSYRIKTFKKGTVHFEIDSEIANFLNRILAKSDKLAIGDSNIIKENSRSKKNKFYKGTFIDESISENVLKLAREIRLVSRCPDYLKKYFTDVDSGSYFVNMLSLSKDASHRIGSILNYLGGKEITSSVYVFEFDPQNALVEIGVSRSFPDIKSHQFYPTPESISEYVLSVANITEEDKVLEPSAGHGSLIVNLDKKDNVTAVEISELGCTILKTKGFENVLIKDFLKCSKNDFKTGFDKIIMNPPYNDNQYTEHVSHALHFLKPSGTLIAVLPVNYKGKLDKILSGKNVSIENLRTFEKEFKDTDIAVTVLRISKVN